MRKIFFYTLVLTLFVSCQNKSKDVAVTDPDLKTVLNNYGLQEVKHPLPQLAGNIYDKVKNELDLSKVTVYKDKTGSFTYLIAFKSSDKMYAYKNGSELVSSRKMKDAKNGTIAIMRDNGAVLITFKDGAREIRDMTSSEYKVQQTLGFCQGSPVVSFGDCYRRECDEFCDGFWSCAALATQPTIGLLIGISCSCYADNGMPALPVAA